MDLVAVVDRVRNLVKRHRKAVWRAYFISLTGVLVICSTIIQPVNMGFDDLKPRPMLVDFKNVTLGYGNHTLELELTVAPLVNYSWALGFNVTGGLLGQDKAGYVWLYHDVVDKDLLLVNIRMWISCRGRPRYVETPWEEQEWDVTLYNNIKISLTQDSIIAGTGKNFSVTETQDSCNFGDWASPHYPYKMRLECFRFEGQCPLLTQKCRQGNELSKFTLVLKVLSFGSMSVFLGMGFSVIWIYFLDINIWQMAAVYDAGRMKEAQKKAKADKIETVEAGLDKAPSLTL